MQTYVHYQAVCFLTTSLWAVCMASLDYHMHRAQSKLTPSPCALATDGVCWQGHCCCSIHSDLICPAPVAPKPCAYLMSLCPVPLRTASTAGEAPGAEIVKEWKGTVSHTDTQVHLSFIEEQKHIEPLKMVSTKKKKSFTMTTVELVPPIILCVTHNALVKPDRHCVCAVTCVLKWVMVKAHNN